MISGIPNKAGLETSTSITLDVVLGLFKKKKLTETEVKEYIKKIIELDIQLKVEKIVSMYYNTNLGIKIITGPYSTYTGGFTYTDSGTVFTSTLINPSSSSNESV